MRRGSPLLALAALAAGGCGQKGPLYLPDQAGRVVTSPPAASQPQPAAAPATPATAPPANAPAATPATPKPADKDKDQDSQPPK